ncbi:MAG: queuosine salvage family protein [Chloroflexi bacterium]|nr:queuosine salvage family protein [Chloroflexota bacterium]
MVLHADYTYATMKAEIQAIVDAATDCIIDENQLVALAGVMRSLPQDYLDQRLYSGVNLHPERYPDQTLPKNDLDTIQLALGPGSQGFFIWVRDLAGNAVPWSVTVGGRRYIGAPSIYACHMRALRRGLNILDPAVMAGLTMRDIREYYRDEETGQTTIQHLEGRLAKYREIGRVLQERFAGYFANLLDEAEGYLFGDDGKGIVQLLVRHFPITYGDWPFCKLVMVNVRGLYQRRQAAVPTGERFAQLTALKDPEHFEAGADYYRPYFLMRVGVLRISKWLQQTLSDQDLLAADSKPEQECRAATIVACRRLAEVMGTPLFHPEAETWETAFLRCRLCRPGISDEELYCPYKSVCRAYQEDPDLMRIRWPLVYTLRH